MRQNKILQDRFHERVRTVFKKSVDPELKSAVQSELCSKNLVLSKYQEQDTDGNSQHSKRQCIRIFWV